MGSLLGSLLGPQWLVQPSWHQQGLNLGGYSVGLRELDFQAQKFQKNLKNTGSENKFWGTNFRLRDLRHERDSKSERSLDAFVFDFVELAASIVQI